MLKRLDEMKVVSINADWWVEGRVASCRVSQVVARLARAIIIDQSTNHKTAVIAFHSWTHRSLHPSQHQSLLDASPTVLSSELSLAVFLLPYKEKISEVRDKLETVLPVLRPITTIYRSTGLDRTKLKLTRQWKLYTILPILWFLFKTENKIYISS